MHTTGVTILTTDLARTDRRALSEAWYGALHVAHAESRARATPPHAASRTHAGARGRSAPVVRNAQRPSIAVAPQPASRSRASAGRTCIDVERRVVPSPLSRRIERAIAARAHRLPGSTVTIGDRMGRVLVMVRTDGRRTFVVAACAPALREHVERALAHARFVLGTTSARIEAA